MASELPYVCDVCGGEFETPQARGLHQSKMCHSDEAWKDKDELKRMYWEDEKSLNEIADANGVSRASVIRAMDTFGIPRRDQSTVPETEGEDICEICNSKFETAWALLNHQSHAHQLGEKDPWMDEDTLRELYLGEELPMRQIGDRLGCSLHTIRRWLLRYDIPIRTEAAIGRSSHAAFFTLKDGYERWSGTGGEVLRVHQLLAIAEGENPHEVFDDDTAIHHGPEAQIPWANWPGNLQLLTNSEHSKLHAAQKSRVDGQWSRANSR